LGLLALRLQVVNYNSSHTDLLLNDVCLTNEFLKSEIYVTTDGQSTSLSWNKAPIWGLRPDFYYCQTVAGLLIWGVLSNERMGLSFTIAAGPRKRSPSRGPSPVELTTTFYCIRFETSFFIASYDSGKIYSVGRNR
jgi:hypothetical protein